jgi:hypothetical protein
LVVSIRINNLVICCCEITQKYKIYYTYRCKQIFIFCYVAGCKKGFRGIDSFQVLKLGNLPYIAKLLQKQHYQHVKLAQRNDFFLVLSHKNTSKVAFQGKFDVLVELEDTNNGETMGI